MAGGAAEDGQRCRITGRPARSHCARAALVWLLAAAGAFQVFEPTILLARWIVVIEYSLFTLLVLLGALLLLRFFESGQRRWLAFAGLAFGFGVLCKQDCGAGALAARIESPSEPPRPLAPAASRSSSRRRPTRRRAKIC